MPPPIDFFGETVPAQELLDAMTGAHADTLKLARLGGVLSTGGPAVVPVTTLHAETLGARDEAVVSAALVADSLLPFTPRLDGPGVPLVVDGESRVPLYLTHTGQLEAPAGFGPVTNGALVEGFEFLQALSLTTPSRVPVVVGSDGRVAVWLENGRLGCMPGAGMLAAIADAILNAGSADGLPTGYDLVLLAGQSNVVGYAAAPSTVQVAPGLGYHWSHAPGTPTVGTLQPVVDPVHHLDDGILPLSHPRGSAWPAFALEYVRRTRRGVILVNAGMGGTGLLAATNTRDDWSASGAAKSRLFAQSVAMVRAARDAAVASGLDVRLRGVIWGQGESDGDASVSEATYRTALDALALRYRVALGAGCPLYVLQTGRYAPANNPNNVIDSVRYEAIRRAQRSHCAADPLSHLVSVAAYDFPARGLMTDEFHYASAGYDELGRLAARAVALCPPTAAWMPPTGAPEF